MQEALAPAKVRSIYDATASRYDWQHGLVTLRSDERGRRMVVEWGVKAGDRVLDAGGGTGSTALRAAEVAGTTGKVVVLDLSEGMLSVARARAEASGLAARMEFQAGDLLALPFETGSFDAVLSTYSVCPIYDPVQGVRELYRVVRGGGVLSMAHSAEPPPGAVRWFARKLDSLVWRIPMLSLGCRPVEVLPALLEDGAELLHQAMIGVPLYPFTVFAVRKPPNP